MAASSASNVQQHVMSLSETASSQVQSFTSLPSTMNSTTRAAVTLATAAKMEQVDPQRSWLGMFGRMTLVLIKVVPGILYWIITFTTITMPTFLFTLFSTSLTFTMNATTL